MTINATLTDLFGQGATQTATALTFPVSVGLTAEGALVELIARLLSYRAITLDTEDGQPLQTEAGDRLTFSIDFTFIETEIYSVEFKGNYLVHKIFLGFNSENI